jgi:SAM-dependent methyltransferase
MKTTLEMIKIFYKQEEHPYNVYEKKISEIVKCEDTILDAGCGRTVPVLKKFLGKAKHLIGVDLVEKDFVNEQIQYIVSDISEIKDVNDCVANIVISRAVLEHVEYPEKVFKEINRILVPGGKFIFLVPNFYDYGSLLSMLIPNKYHAKIVNKTEGRDIQDTFPAFYRANTFSKIKKISDENNFVITSFDYLGQYPSYFMFSRILFLFGTLYDKFICHFDCLKYFRGWLLVVVEKK